jgi:hypothetical protein
VRIEGHALDDTGHARMVAAAIDGHGSQVTGSRNQIRMDATSMVLW